MPSKSTKKYERFLSDKLNSIYINKNNINKTSLCIYKWTRQKQLNTLTLWENYNY